jgi:hypothetical protein
MTTPSTNVEQGTPTAGHEPQTGEFVTIYVDDKPIQIHRGNQKIATIKEKAGVPLADQLQLEKPDGTLEKLDQDGSITLKGGEKFQSFSATGRSS